MRILASVVEATLLTAGTLGAGAGLYLLLLALAALFYRETPPLDTPSSHLTVLVPAHDEADLIRRCLASLRAQDYPARLYDVVVIADNCTDETAQLARSAGATVLVRDAPDARGKGQALRWAMDRLLARGGSPDAFIIVDADSIAEPSMLRCLASSFERGSPVVQADYTVLCDPTAGRVQLRALAFLLFHRARFSGRAVLGLPCSLVGNGMLLATEVVASHPWSAFTPAEDLEYTLTLRLAGIRPAYSRAARIQAPVPATAGSAQVQRERWEGGRLHLVRRALPGLLRDVLVGGRLRDLDLAVDLAVPPLGLLALWLLAVAMPATVLAATGMVPALTVAPSLVGLVSVIGFVVTGLLAAGAPAEMFVSLLLTPVFLAEKLMGTAGVFRNQAADRWIRTERPGDAVS